MNCDYCEREISTRLVPDDPLRATRDHVIPRSKGGTKTVFACLACNNIKGDMMPDEWSAYMAENPRWWTRYNSSKIFFTPEPRNRIKAPPLDHTIAFLKAAALRAGAQGTK